MRIRFRELAVAGLMSLPWLAQAGGLEDAWRRFFEQHPRAATIVRPPAMAEVTQPTVALRTDNLPLGKNEYAVFVAPGCRVCTEAVAGLRATGANVAVLDVTRSDTARQAWLATGARGLPVSIVGRHLITGWSRAAFDRAIIGNMHEEMREQQGS